MIIGPSATAEALREAFMEIGDTGMKDVIEIPGNYRLKRCDALNWKLQHFHEPEKNNPKTKREGARWYDTGLYFQQLGPALAAVFERRMRDEGPEVEQLRDAMERAGVIRDELMRAVP